MEFLFIILIIFGIIGWIKESNEKRREKIADDIAKETFNDFNYKQEKNKIENKINFYKKEKKKILKRFSFFIV